MTKEELIQQKRQLKIVLEYINKCIILMEKHEQLDKTIERVDDRKSIKLQLLKTDLKNTLGNEEE